jgi:choline dehydrogenase-like flavoprotein
MWHNLLEFCKENISSSWHMTGTAKMGKAEEPDTVVDNNFRVVGVGSLRVADMSVLPILPNAHTQVPAYITGATCAEKLIEEYNLA